MTTPPHDPADDLDGDGVSVSELVAQLDNGLRQLVQRVDTHEDQILDTLESLAAELDALRKDIDGTAIEPSMARKRPGDAVAAAGTTDDDSDSDEPPVPRRWAARATREDWDNLVDWVDELRMAYSLPNGYVVAPCWPAHPGVVEELAGLYRAWADAVFNDEQTVTGGSSAVTAWHDRWLWPSLERFRSAKYRSSNCTTTHVEEPKNATHPTDLTLIPSCTVK